MKDQQKNAMELGDEEEEEEDDDEDEDDEEGPPPGFQCIAVQKQKETMEADQNEEEEEEEEYDDDEDDDDDSDGPPPGWSPIPQRHQISDAEMFDKQDDDDDVDDNGPPPGWDMPPPTPQLAEAIPSGEMEGKQEKTKAEASTPPTDQPTIVSQPLASIPPLPAPATMVPSEKGQLVCGSCRQLLSYPRGAKYVRCSCCQTVNLVLEAHQVGQVKCGGCAVLLMYPYGAPSVKCSSCCFLTEIGEHNRRPPLSVQQERGLPLFNRVH